MFGKRRGCRLPNSFVQEIYIKDKKAYIIRGKTKVFVLKVDVECPDLVAFIVYATNLVHFLSMAAEKLVWDINEKEIYYKAT